MSIFTTPTIYNEPSFSGLFRLLDDFDNYRSSTAANSQNQQQQQVTTGASGNTNNHQRQQLTGRGGGLLGQMSSFSPKFDLRETDTAFELRGDLPGVDKDQVQIEFADEHTLTIRGRVEREWSSSSNDTSNDNNNNNNDKKDGKNNNAEATSKSSSGKEDKHDTGSGSNGNTNTDAAASKGTVQQQQQGQGQTKYWITERSVGEFSRSFRLTGHHGHSHHNHYSHVDDEVEIDHDGVTAKLDNGVLSVVVPKVVRERKQARRKVQIN